MQEGEMEKGQDGHVQKLFSIGEEDFFNYLNKFCLFYA